MEQKKGLSQSPRWSLQMTSDAPEDYTEEQWAEICRAISDLLYGSAFADEEMEERTEISSLGFLASGQPFVDNSASMTLKESPVRVMA